MCHITTQHTTQPHQNSPADLPISLSLTSHTQRQMAVYLCPSNEKLLVHVWVWTYNAHVLAVFPRFSGTCVFDLVSPVSKITHDLDCKFQDRPNALKLGGGWLKGANPSHKRLSHLGSLMPPGTWPWKLSAMSLPGTSCKRKPAPSSWNADEPMAFSATPTVVRERRWISKNV